MILTASQRGFTLAETLTALAIVGLGLFLAVPGLDSLARSSRLAESVNQLVTTMHLARSEAVTRNARVTVCASGDGAHCEGQAWEQGWIAFLDADADAEHGPAEEVLDRVAGLTGTTVRSAEFPGAFSFQPTGRVTTAGQDTASGRFAFCEPQAREAARLVILRANGLPTLSQDVHPKSAGDCPTS